MLGTVNYDSLSSLWSYILKSSQLVLFCLRVSQLHKNKVWQLLLRSAKSSQDHMKYKLEFGLRIHFKNAYWTGIQSVLLRLQKRLSCNRIVFFLLNYIPDDPQTTWIRSCTTDLIFLLSTWRTVAALPMLSQLSTQAKSVQGHGICAVFLK